MGLNIKNEETVRLVRELADRLGVSMTAAITDAVRSRLETLATSEPEVDTEADRLLAMWRELGDGLGRDYLAQDFDAILYDEMGLPK